MPSIWRHGTSLTSISKHKEWEFRSKMIPICQDPKRFVAALNKERVTMLLRGTRGTILRSANLTILQHRSVSTLSLPFFNQFNAVKVSSSFIRPFSTSLNKVSAPPTWIEGDKSPKIVSVDLQQQKMLDTLPLLGPRTAEWWTGKAPSNCPGFADGKLYSLPQATFDNLTRHGLQAYFDNTWTLTEVMMSSLQGEEAFMRPPYHDLRHPMIFYYGHPAVLYINKLRVAGLLPAPINPYFESIFETGVDEMSWDDLSKNKMSWPSVKEVHAYRCQVYQTISALIQTLPDQQVSNITQASPLWALVMSFEHERIHLETSSFLINELPSQFVRFPDRFPPYHPSVHKTYNTQPVAGVDYPINTFIPVQGKQVKIGKPASYPSFGWDNEYGQRVYEVPGCQVSKFKVTNGEYWEFVKEGGYANRAYWTDIGWKWRAFRNSKTPLMWVRKGPQGYHEYDLRLVFDTVHMPWDWPVVVNYHEATAFAQWKSEREGKQFRVLSELEHRLMRDESDPENKAHDPVAMYAGNEMSKVGVTIVLLMYNRHLIQCSLSLPFTLLQANINANLSYVSMSP
ncbi:5-histidylcysteine sulfoxide synthase, partial [archaeon]